MLRITLRQLEAFYWAAKLGAVAAAAKHLHMSQPAITSRVKELEATLGLNLLTRSQQGVHLTPSGHEFLQRAERMLQLGEEFERGGGKVLPPLDGVLRIGADDTFAAVGMSALLRRLHQLYPALRIDLCIEPSKVLKAKLSRREIDIALQTSPTMRPHVVDRFLGDFAVSWVCHPSQQLPNSSFSPDDAASVQIVINPEHSVLHYLVRDWLGNAGADLNHFNTCNSLAMIAKMVVEGQAIAALPVPIIQKQLNSGSIKLIDATPPLPPIGYYASFLTEKQATGVETIMNLAEDLLREAKFFLQAPADD